MLNMLINKDINNLYPLYSPLATCFLKNKNVQQEEVQLMNIVHVLHKGMMEQAAVESSKSYGKFISKIHNLGNHWFFYILSSLKLQSQTSKNQILQYLLQSQHC